MLIGTMFLNLTLVRMFSMVMKEGIFTDKVNLISDTFLLFFAGKFGTGKIFSVF